MTTLDKILIAIVAALTTTLIITNAHRIKNSDSALYQQEAKVLQQLEQQYDSIMHHSARDSAKVDSLLSRIQALDKQNSDQHQQINLLWKNYQQTLRQYASLHKYDTLSAADISRYLSDSLP